MPIRRSRPFTTRAPPRSRGRSAWRRTLRQVRSVWRARCIIRPATRRRAALRHKSRCVPKFKSFTDPPKVICPCTRLGSFRPACSSRRSRSSLALAARPASCGLNRRDRRSSSAPPWPAPVWPPHRRPRGSARRSSSPSSSSNTRRRGDFPTGFRLAPTSHVRAMPSCSSVRPRAVSSGTSTNSTSPPATNACWRRLPNCSAAPRRRSRPPRRRGGIATFDLSDDGSRVLVPLSEKLYVLERSTGAVHKLTSTAGSPIDAQFSPDGKLIACVRDGDLYVTDVATGSERRLTTGATATLSHGLAEFVAQEEMDRMHGYWWSPDGQQLVYQETNTASVEELSIPDPAHPA